MSSDPKALSAFAMKTKCPLRYFELVTIINGDQRRTCYCGLGKHSMYFYRINWDGPIFPGEGAEVPYAFIRKVVEDKNSNDQFMLFLSDNRSPYWTSERVYITSAQRAMFLRNLRVGFQTDYMWRLGRVKEMPISVFELRDKEKAMASDIPVVQAFLKWKWRYYEDYKFMLPDQFKDVGNNIAKAGCGEFEDYDVKTKGFTNCIIHVHDILTLDQAKFLGRDNIRWVAQAYREGLLRDVKQFYVTKNAPYQKRMNFVGDVASWIAWEMCIRTEEKTLICVLLRRQYLPPVCCCLQDIAVIYRCDAAALKNPEDHAAKMREVRLVADSMSSTATRFTVYRPVVSSKLNALQFDDQGITWVRAYLKIAPKWRRQAKRFLRKILDLLQKDSALPAGYEDILHASPTAVIINADPEEAWAELPPIEDMFNFLLAIRKGNDELKHFKDNAGLPQSEDPIPEDYIEKFQGNEALARHSWTEDRKKIYNSWYFRVSRYFAWALDGGILGARFTLDTLLQGISFLSDPHRKIIMMVLSFLLHIRKRNVEEMYEEKALTPETLRAIERFDNSLPLSNPDAMQSTIFNESVMMTLLQSDYLRRSVFDEKRKDEYFALLGRFLMENCNVDFKAYVCRLIMESGSHIGGHSHHVAFGPEIVALIIPPLVSVIESDNIFLSIYAYATLVNVTHGDESAKASLIASSIGPLLLKSLTAKDDDLVAYALMLAVNLTKEPSHRNVLAEAGIIPACYDILTSSYSFSVPPGKNASATPGSNDAKVRLLTQLCIVMGQFCNDSMFRKLFAVTFEHAVKCLIFIVMNATPFTPLECKALFALKQVAVDAESQKLVIANYCSKKIIDEFRDTKSEKKTLDFCNQAALFLQLLANSLECQQKLHACGLTTKLLDTLMNDRTYKILVQSPDLQQRVQNLRDRMEEMELHAFD